MQEAIREAEAGNFQEVWQTPLTPAQAHVCDIAADWGMLGFSRGGLRVLQGISLHLHALCDVKPCSESPGCSRNRRKDICLSNALSPLHVQVKDLMQVLERPFDEQPGAEKYRVAAPREVRMGVELLSCSS